MALIRREFSWIVERVTACFAWWNMSNHDYGLTAYRRPLAIAAIIAVVLVGCGGGPSPSDVVNDFVNAYAKGDIKKACSLYERDGEGNMTDALQNTARNADDLRAIDAAFAGRNDPAGYCLANVGLTRKWDPDPSRVTSMKITDVDQDEEHAKVSSSLGTWTLHEVDGGWKLSNADPVIPPHLRPPSAS